jgi:hypothetical protein
MKLRSIVESVRHDLREHASAFDCLRSNAMACGVDISCPEEVHSALGISQWDAEMLLRQDRSPSELAEYLLRISR